MGIGSLPRAAAALAMLSLVCGFCTTDRIGTITRNAVSIPQRVLIGPGVYPLKLHPEAECARVGIHYQPVGLTVTACSALPLTPNVYLKNLRTAVVSAPPSTVIRGNFYCARYFGRGSKPEVMNTDMSSSHMRVDNEMPHSVGGFDQVINQDGGAVPYLN